MRSAAIAFLATFALGLAVLGILGMSQRSDLVYSPGVNPAMAVRELRTGIRACQAPLRPPDGAEFDRVAVTLGTFGRPGPEVRIEVLEAGGERELGSGRLAAGYADVDEVPSHLVDVGLIRTRAPIEVCVINEDRQRVALFGQPGVASPSTSGSIDGTAVDVDFAVSLRSPERSLLALLPVVMERAALFRADWISPAVYIVLGLMVLIGAPLLLARGLAAAAREDAA